ncbi:hypothetical protein L7F22_061085 [Adiantum nelumboides]|nr:hypothetical protein [Adiantum nelumboides]
MFKARISTFKHQLDLLKDVGDVFNRIKARGKGCLIPRDGNKTYGQSEEANSTVLDLLKCYVSDNKSKWEQYLPLLEYAYNNTVHSSTGKAPFEIVEGGKKVPPILHTKDKIFEADQYVQTMDEMYKKIKLALEKTQAKQKRAADLHRRELVFSLGDWVLLRFEKARLKKMKGKERLFPKLSMRYYGPFQVTDKISDVAYRLKLPEHWRIHNAFHVSLLRPFVGDVPENMPVEDQPEVEELDEILVPEQIMAHKERKVKGKVARRYLVKFKNYPPMDAKWMEESELQESPNILQLYLEAFGLNPTYSPMPIISKEQRLKVTGQARTRNDDEASTSHIYMDSVQ